MDEPTVFCRSGADQAIHVQQAYQGIGFRALLQGDEVRLPSAANLQLHCGHFVRYSKRLRRQARLASRVDIPSHYFEWLESGNFNNLHSRLCSNGLIARGNALCLLRRAQ